ncbi:lasso peptide biosynthesis PqqD family chaperone [Mesobacillus foraminis]|uniref:lasso peptide biosynthesis PqqD family chaperone n=1 Tax=Mesobacillus foraminis TaxID=279826 RepID=UPI001BE813F6|nr:lasso peptide biosynthesis PqqD family chaperone [Mesobacillus foraminis]MBT2758428.1 lasso peptide biosynthesis PqqD family chaperone [Mesobacillus foraminis]
MVDNKAISLNQIVAQVKGNIVSDMGGEKVMLSVEKGKYFNLGEVGGEIWNLIGEKIVVSELVITLLTKYNVDQSACEEHVISFLESLYKEDLIEVYTAK